MPRITWHANFFADTSCNTPLIEGHISIPSGPGRSSNEPMTIILRPLIQSGKYIIRNRMDVTIFWARICDHRGIESVNFYRKRNMNFSKKHDFLQVNKHSPFIQANVKIFSKWDITNDNFGSNIFITSPLAASSTWVGACMSMSTVPVPWLLIPADGQFY